MKTSPSGVSWVRNGWLFGLVVAGLALGLTIAGVAYQRSVDVSCGGRLSAGFPVAVVCDASGESPLSSVGQIDWADTDSVYLPGVALDVVFYAAVIGGAGLGLRRLARGAGGAPLGQA